MLRAGLFNFSKGEIGPQLQGRIDVPAYNAALRQATNVTVLKYGGISRRLGTRLVYEIPEPAEGWDAPEATARLLPFEYSIEQSYALLMRQATMNPLAYGGAVLEEELAIVNIFNQANTRITIPYHGFEVGDEIFPTGIDGDLGLFLNERVWTVNEIVDVDNFKINADTRNEAAFTGATGGITRPAPPAPVVPPPVPAPTPPAPPPDTWRPGGWTIDGFEGYSDRRLRGL